MSGHDGRCPSRIAHESGVVKQCQFEHVNEPPVPGIHGTSDGVLWRGDDERVIVLPPEQRPAKQRTDAEEAAVAERVGYRTGRWVAGRGFVPSGEVTA
jgi:hypothetical protein